MTIEGRVLADRYAIGELLGRGGMAEVYLATDRVLDRLVAVKVLGGWLAHDGTFVERFRREALASARISHPNLVAVFDTGSEDGVHYIVMEHVRGETLADALRRDGRLPPNRATRIATSVADALGVAHAAGIVHRDVKPANVMLTPDGRTKLMDLGIARSMDGESITRTSSILGTAGYISPEQARGDPVDHRSDVYSLGCVLYEMLTGRPPFTAGEPVAVAYKHVHEAPAPPTSLEPSVPPSLEAVTLRAMEKDPAARFQIVAEMSSALNDRGPIGPITATTPMPAVAVPSPPTGARPRRADRPSRRRPVVPILLGLAALALIAVMAFAAFDSDPRPAATQRRSPTSTPSAPAPTTPPPTTQAPPPSPDSVEAAAAALDALVAEGLADGTISEKSAEDVGKRLEDALDKFREGDTEQAVDKLDDIVKEIEKAVDDGEIAHSQEQRLRRAIEDLAEQMIAASPSEED